LQYSKPDPVFFYYFNNIIAVLSLKNAYFHPKLIWRFKQLIWSDPNLELAGIREGQSVV